MRNVHKTDVDLVNFPSDALCEDKGARNCKQPQRVLADPTDVISWKNDRTPIAYKFDSMEVELESSTGEVFVAPGISVAFPYQADAVGFVIDWRQFQDSQSNLRQGCWKVKINWALAGATGSFYYGSFELRQYSIANAAKTVRLLIVLNDYVRNQGINFKDSGFAGTVRFQGQFGYMQPNYDTLNNTHTNRTRYKVRNEAVRSYELRTNWMLRCMTRLVDEQTLLAANQIYVTDHNANNHVQCEYYDFPIILHEDESPTFEYTDSVYAKVKAVFLDKQALHESKYDGNIQGSDNVIFSLPTVVATPLPASTPINVNGTNEGSIDPATAIDVDVENSGGITIVPDSIDLLGNTLTLEIDTDSILTGAKPLVTGQTSTGAPGDDGNTQRGRGVNFTTLEFLNPFGNTDRFTDTLGGQTYANDIKMDWQTFRGGTAYGWYTGDANTPRDYAAASAICLTYVVDGFADWYYPNGSEYWDIMDKGLSSWVNYPPFNFTLALSTSTERDAARMYLYIPQQTQFAPFSKSTPYRHFAIRVFTVTVTGTGVVLT